MNRRNGVTALLVFLALLFASFGRVVNAISVHYEFDRPHYHPGDTGKLLLVCNNDSPDDMVITRAEMAIADIGTFKSNMSGLPLASNLPPNTRGYLLKTRQTANIEICFRIPADARPGEYDYSWTIDTFPSNPFTTTDTLRVYGVGEESPPEPPSPFLLGLVALPILLVAYPLVRWRSKRVARIVAVAIVILIVTERVYREAIDQR